LIDHNNDQRGVVPTSEAMSLAREVGQDLVEVSPMERPPVCRIMDYGKYKYTLKKKSKQRTGHEIELKEIRLRPKTDPHDLQIKMKKAKQFIEEGDKVQFTMQFRGREKAHQEIAYEIFRNIVADFGEAIKVERTPLMEGKRMIMILVAAPKKGSAGHSPTNDGTPARGPNPVGSPANKQGMASPSAPAAPARMVASSVAPKPSA
jgi:translation initiation factor IF-3